jgi:hypothetical protein
MEEWKNCDFDTRYKISNYGNIKRILSNGNERNIKPSILNKNKTHPYYYIQIQKEGKRKNFLIHRLVAFAFCENHSEINNICDHIDRNTFNNHYTNLRWGTQKDNMNNLVFNHTIESRKEYAKKYVREIRSQKIECECGRIVAKYNLSQHRKSKIHVQRIFTA